MKAVTNSKMIFSIHYMVHSRIHDPVQITLLSDETSVSMHPELKNYGSKDCHQVKKISPSHSFGKKRVEGIVHHLVGVVEVRVGDQKKSFSCLRSHNNKDLRKLRIFPSNIFSSSICHSTNWRSGWLTSFWSRRVIGSSSSSSTNLSGLL